MKNIKKKYLIIATLLVMSLLSIGSLNAEKAPISVETVINDSESKTT